MMKPATHCSRISDKWKAYSGMAAAFLVVAKDSDAQVVYTDVDPDAAVISGNYDVDFDNDGDRDLAVGQESRLLLMENDGTGKFELSFGISSRAQTFSLAAADYDADGDVDLFAN